MERGKKRLSIERMKDSLYSRTSAPKINPDIRTPLEQDYAEHPQVAWEDTKIVPTPSAPPTAPYAKKRMSFTTKFFIGSFTFFLIALFVAGYLFFGGANNISTENIDLQVVAPSIVDGGKPTQFEILIANRNQSQLQLADVSIDYPIGSRDPADQTKALTHNRQSIGAIDSGQQLKRTTSAVFYGSEGSPQKVLVTLEYSVPGSNSIFKKQAEADFVIGSSPVSIEVTAPKEAIANQPFTMDVKVTSNSQALIQDLVLQGQYPFGFTVTKTDPKADTGGTIWRIGKLAPNDTRLIHITGSIDGQDGDERMFRFLTGSIADQTDTQIKVPFIIVPQSLTVHRPFVGATIALNSQTGKTVSIVGNQTINGVVHWQNNLKTPVSNLELRLSLQGPMLDAANINSANGFYQSNTSSIIWSKDTEPSLELVAPGASGDIPFTFNTLAPGASGTVYTNPTISLNLSVSGVREGQAGVPETVASAASVDATIASAASVNPIALYFTGPFKNSGPVPPVVGQSTSYTIVWTVSNSSNTVGGATVSAVLPAYMTFVSSDASSNIIYNPGSRTVSWSLGDIKAGAGYSLQARVASFQVSLLPSSSQNGQAPRLTGDTKLSGQDRFAQVPIQVVSPGPTTQLTDDPSFVATMGTVQSK